MRQEVVIRRARPEDAPICRMLLPEAARSGLCDLLIAATPERPYVAGAACVQRLPDRLTGVHVHVIPPLRRRGVGSRLLERVLAEGAAAGAASAAGWFDLVQHPAAPPFAAVHRFTEGERLTTVEWDTGIAYAYFDRMRQRWHRHGASRPHHVVRLADASRAQRDEVARMWNDFIVERPASRTDVVTSELARGAFDDSPVLLQDGAVAGFLLLRGDGDRGWAEGQVVAPWARTGWVFAALGVAGCDVWRARGIRIGHFDWREGVSNPAKLARRLNGRIVRAVQEVTRDLA